MSSDYLKTPIVGMKITETPHYGMTADGYTKRSGAPTSRLIRLEGEKRWRRLMCWQFSNAGTCFIRIKGETLIVADSDLPLEETKEKSTTKFRDLKVGDTFEFDRTGFEYSGMASGPWKKTSARGYKRIHDGMDCRVGTINVSVIKA
jgi:hypothetical protein